MNASDQFKKYTETVCEQIRWKKAHDVVSREIENHLIDQKNAYIDMGDSESTAEEKALLQMGDPVAVGAALDGTHKPKPQWGMILLVVGLCLIGTLMQLQFLVLFDDADLILASKQSLLFGLILGLAAFVGAYLLDFSSIGKHFYLLPIFFLFTDVWGYLFGLEAGSKSVFAIGRFSFGVNTSTLLFPLAFCGLCYQFRKKGQQGYLHSCLLGVVSCVWLLSFHGPSSIFIFLLAGGVMLLFAAKKRWFGNNTLRILLVFAIIGLLAAVFLVMTVPYYRYRFGAVLTAIRPETDPMGSGFFPLFLREMLAESSIIGGTLSAKSHAAFLYGTTFRSDYFFTFITSWYGWVVSLGLLALLVLFLVIGYRKALKQRSVLGQMVALVILTTFAAEILLYMLNNFGFLLMAPISLPFLSYGSTSLFIHTYLAGTLLSVFRTGDVHVDDAKPAPAKDSRFIQWEDGRLIISFK